MAQTVQLLTNIWIQEIDPLSFGLYECDCAKRRVGVANYFNAGFFAVETGGKTIPVGNLANDEYIITQSCDNPTWINVARKPLTTIYVTTDGVPHMAKLDNLSSISNLKTAISGIPIISNGRRVDITDIKKEGYDGSELYDTWHGFLGIRQNKLVYVAAKCDFGQMCWILVALGIYDAIKLDGGGSFILHNDVELIGTSENRRINNVGMWE